MSKEQHWVSAIKFNQVCEWWREAISNIPAHTIVNKQVYIATFLGEIYSFERVIDPRRQNRFIHVSQEAASKIEHLTESGHGYALTKAWVAKQLET